MVASPLVKERIFKPKFVKDDLVPLVGGVKVFRGGLAMCVTSGAHAGNFQPANATDVGVVVGKFAESVDNSAGADGAAKANVIFFVQREIDGWDNDTVAPVTNAMRETTVFVLDDHTATAAPNATPIGVLFNVSPDGKRVWVEGRRSEPQVSQEPLVQRGTSTLVAGTKTINGVNLTATSVIEVTMRDPGAGAITSMAGFAVPVASRNVGAGSFVVNAIDGTKATIVTAVCTFDWTIVG